MTHPIQYLRIFGCQRKAIRADELQYTSQDQSPLTLPQFLLDLRSKTAMLSWWLVLVLCCLQVVKGKDIPEISATALKLHKLYIRQPPHDRTLYDTLQVSPNATASQISKSYRVLTRKYHPDKQQHQNLPDGNTSESKLRSIQEAYEILNNDATRLPYHQYGLTDPSLAVILLLGPKNHYQNTKVDTVHQELLKLMGYNNHHYQQEEWSHPQQRVRIVAAQLVEQLRPLIEGTVDPQLVSHQVANDCDRWKTYPFGAQIVRCVGRAYRHAGQDYLLLQNSKSKLVVSWKQQWRQAKHLVTAAFATGRATVTEHVWTRQDKQRRRQQKKRKKQTDTPEVEYHHLSSLGEVDLENYDDDPAPVFNESDDDDEDMKHLARLKAQQTLLQSLQVEALWKISKVDLDKTIRKACELILNGDYFFFPSHQSPFPREQLHQESSSQIDTDHGWVGTTGKVVHAEQARLEAAQAMIMIGEIMVQRSKDGTSWKD